MKKLVLIMIMCSSYVYSMEKELTSFTCTHGTTQINLVKGHIESFDGKATIIVLGENERDIETSQFCMYSKSIIISGRSPDIYLMYDEHSCRYDLCYYRYVYISPDNNVRRNKFYKNEQAVRRAEKDMNTVYQNILKGGHLYGLRNNSKKSIAIPVLGVSTNFPKDKAAECAVSAIMGEVIDRPGHYDIIYLVMNNEDNFARYKKLLEKYIR